MVGWRKAGNELTRAIGCNLIVIVTTKTNISMSRIENIEWEEWGRMGNLPFKVLPSARAVLGNAMDFLDG